MPLIRSCALAFTILAAGLAAQTPSLAGLPVTPPLRSAASDSFSFIVAGDNRPMNASLPQPPTPGQIFAAAKAQRVNFVVWTGDMIYGLEDENTSILAAQYKAFFALASTAGVPVFATTGNHEMNIKVKSAAGVITEVGSTAMEAAYRQNMGLAPGAPIYGSFNYGNTHFVLLNTSEVAPKAAKRAAFAKPAPDVNLDPGYISPSQLAWLKQDLAANTALHTFVFMHHPITALKADMQLNRKSGDELVAVFNQHTNISYVLASHEHLYYNVQTTDITPPAARTDPSSTSPVYVVSGGAGAKLTGTPEQGGFHHYVKYTVRGGTVQPELVRLP